MELKDPFLITSRLMAGVKVGEAYISLGYSQRTDEGRMNYGCYIDLPDGREFEVTDLNSGVGGGGIQEGMTSLLSFLSAAADSYGFEQRNPGTKGECTDLFPLPVVEWAYENSDEISSLEHEIEETKGLVVE